MKNVRVIARLDVKGPNVVKGIQFEALRIMGNPGEMAREYYAQGADELIYLDIVASLYRRDSLLHIVREASRSIFIPFTAGGGVRSVADIHDLLHAGAEKVAINTGAIQRPELIREAAQKFGSQCIVVSIEAKRNKAGSWEAFTDNGRQTTGLDVVEWARTAEALGAGEILLTSVDREGTERGLDQELIHAVSSAVSIPVIAAGGAASSDDAAKAVVESGADAVALATVLHYGKTTIGTVKDALTNRGASIRVPTAQERAFIPTMKDETNVFDVNQYTNRQIRNTVNIDPRATEAVELPVGDAATADVVIIDYGINNVRSVVMAFESFGAKVALATTPAHVRSARRLVLPGVGAFGDGMKAIRERGLDAAIIEKARNGTPILGICLGMQLLFDESEEFGLHEGLGLLRGRVVRFPDPRKVSITDYKLPHIGWREIRPSGAWVYFVHSLYPSPEERDIVSETATYGGVEFAAAIQSGNIHAAQFHPEKSGTAGLAILKSFVST